jgi:NAD(P)H-hydrate epimerase
MLPGRSADGHKFGFGVVVVVAGSLDYAGAAYMTALGAARAGAGLVALAVPDPLRALFAGRLPEAIVLGLPAAADDIEVAGSAIAIAEREPAAIVCGPGLRESTGYGELLLSLLATSAVPVVVDAGALAMLAHGADWWTAARARCVLTPHAGEFERLTGSPLGTADEERLAACRAAAHRFGQVVVLKGARTVICSPDGRSAVSPFANALLATAGSGDVLAGYIGGLLGQGAEPYAAACGAVYLHGWAGERLSATLGDAGLLATELPLEMARARADLVAAHGR